MKFYARLTLDNWHYVGPFEADSREDAEKKALKRFDQEFGEGASEKLVCDVSLFQMDKKPDKEPQA